MVHRLARPCQSLCPCPDGGMPERKLIYDAPFAFLLLRALGLLSDSGRWGSELSPKGSWAGKPLPVRDAAFLPGLQRGLPNPADTVSWLCKSLFCIVLSHHWPVGTGAFRRFSNYQVATSAQGICIHPFYPSIHPPTRLPIHSSINHLQILNASSVSAKCSRENKTWYDPAIEEPHDGNWSFCPTSWNRRHSRGVQAGAEGLFTSAPAFSF